MPNQTQTMIGLQNEIKTNFDKKIKSEFTKKYGNLTYNQVFLILIKLSKKIVEILPDEIPVDS